MPRSLLVVSAVALLAGCGWNECQTSFPDIPFTAANVFTADGSGVGDTLTVAIVSPADRYDLPRLGPGRVGTLAATPSASGAIEVAYVVDGRVFESSATPPLTSVLQGDTLFVAVEGVFDLLREACSPSEGPFYQVDIEAVQAPPGVQGVRVTGVSGAEAAAAFRRLDAERVRPTIVA